MVAHSFPSVFHRLHFWVIKIGCYPTSGGEEGVRELVPVSEVAAKAAEEHVFLIQNSHFSFFKMTHTICCSHS